MRQIRERLDANQLAQVEQALESQCRFAIAHFTESQMQMFLALYDAWPESAMVRQRLAESAWRGEFQRAEILWLKNRQNPDPVIVANANFHLMQLYSQLGLYSEAAVLAEDLASPRLHDVPLARGGTLGNAFSRIPPDSLLATAIRDRQLPAIPIHRVEITEDRWTSTENDLIDAFAQYRREFSLEPGSSFQLLDKGWVIEDGEEPETRVETRSPPCPKGRTLGISSRWAAPTA
jgi:hypothetical protein